MRTRTLLLPAYLLFLLLAARLVWSTVDAEVASFTFQGTDSGFLTGKIAVILVIALLAPFLLAVRKPIQTLGVFPCILYCLAAASVAWTYDIGTTLYALVLLTCVFGYALAMHVFWGSERALAIIWLFASAVVLASIALAVIGDPHALMGGRHEGAWRGLFAHKNAFGPFLVIHLVLTLFGRRYLRLPLVIALFIAVVDGAALYFTRSGTAIIAAVASIAAGLVFIPIRHRALRILWRMGAASVVLIMVLAVLLNVDAVLGLLGRDSTMTGRSALWAQAYDMTFRHWLGTGYGTGGGTQVAIELQKITKRYDALGVQSGYLNLALELGWVAVGLLVVWLVSSIAKSFLSMRATPAHALFVALAVQHLISSYSESFGGIFPSWSLTVLVTAMIAMRTATTVDVRRRRSERGRDPAPATGVAVNR